MVFHSTRIEQLINFTTYFGNFSPAIFYGPPNVDHFLAVARSFFFLKRKKKQQHKNGRKMRCKANGDEKKRVENP